MSRLARLFEVQQAEKLALLTASILFVELSQLCHVKGL